METTPSPKTLQQAIVYFSNPDNCLRHMIEVRWPDGKVTCPTCGAEKVTYLAKQRRWKCYGKHPKPQFSVKVGTIFEDSSLGLDKWMMAMWLIANCKNGVSSCEVARDLGITQKSAWHMLQRIRLAMRVGSFEKLAGHVEIDETWIGGKARNMHRGALAKRVAEFATPRTGRNQNIGKVAVMGLLERNGEVRTMVVSGTKRRMLQGEVKRHVEAGSAVYTDALRSYNNLDQEYIHNVINHAVEYVRGNVHTNGIESFWSLLKRSLGGTYISVEPFHLFRYLDEQSFRFNNRKLSDSERFVIVSQQVIGRRLTYSELTGKASRDA
ncbi:MAG: IS1595 family transposase [Pyrinomonadaceae bacterium]